MLNEKSDLKTS